MIHFGLSMPLIRLFLLQAFNCRLSLLPWDSPGLGRGDQRFGRRRFPCFFCVKKSAIWTMQELKCLSLKQTGHQFSNQFSTMNCQGMSQAMYVFNRFHSHTYASHTHTPCVTSVWKMIVADKPWTPKDDTARQFCYLALFGLRCSAFRWVLACPGISSPIISDTAVLGTKFSGHRVQLHVEKAFCVALVCTRMIYEYTSLCKYLYIYIIVNYMYVIIYIYLRKIFMHSWI